MKILIVTNLGNITLELDPVKAPITVKNFLQYIKDKHFNNTIFHRVIKGFMIQGGGFTKNFKQKKTLAAIKNEADNGLKNESGTIAMARTSEVDSATCQFFINTVDNSFLNYKTPSEFGYCVFGKVIEGMDVVKQIEKVRTGSNGMHRDVPVEAVEILEVSEVE
jgi:cyclophilin family peptidyl-prolyl cis-trans isomerase